MPDALMHLAMTQLQNGQQSLSSLVWKNSGLKPEQAGQANGQNCGQYDYLWCMKKTPYLFVQTFGPPFWLLALVAQELQIRHIPCGMLTCRETYGRMVKQLIMWSIMVEVINPSSYQEMT